MRDPALRRLKGHGGWKRSNLPDSTGRPLRRQEGPWPRLFDDYPIFGYYYSMRPTILDLFSGAGGISHGFEQAGYKVIGGIDLDRDSVATFRRNHPGATGLVADLAAAQPNDLAAALGLVRGELDVLAGGPPCQGFSRNRAFRHQDGVFVDDPRNHLYWHFFEYVAFFRPKVVLMENVPEILIKRNGAFHAAVLERFAALGYAATARVVNAADFGVPQHRRRAMFLAGRDNATVAFPSARTAQGPRAGRRTPNSPDFVGTRQSGSLLPTLFDDVLPVGPTVWDALSDLYGVYGSPRDLSSVVEYGGPPVNQYQRARRGNATFVSNHYVWPLSPRQLARVRVLSEGQGHAHLPPELQVKEGYGSAYRRLQKDAQALTITTWLFHPGSGMFTHPLEDRVLTIREAGRIQSFQDDFVFTGRYHSQCRQVGNAVAPQVARCIGEEVHRILDVTLPHAAEPPRLLGRPVIPAVSTATPRGVEMSLDI
jgi:DNA (cytosine-5)-methyltransferase 1